MHTHAHAQWKSVSQNHHLKELEREEQDQLLREHLARLKQAWKSVANQQPNVA